MTSCSTAPAAGGSSPTAAATIATSDSPMPTSDGLERDPARAAGDEDGVGEGVDAVDGEHDVGGLRRRGRAARGERHPDAGGGEGGGVVDAVADHDGAGRGRLRPDRGELVGGVAVGEHRVDADDAADRLGDVRPVAGDEDRAP